MLLNALMIAAGIAVLAYAGDKLVTFASALAEKANLSPAVIGLTVVAAGTSFPELFVSVMAAMKGSPDIAMGNVVGSNISNLTLILGICAVVAPIPVVLKALKMEYGVMVAASIAVLGLAQDGVLGRVDSAVLLLAMVAFVATSIRLATRAPAPVKAEMAEVVPVEADRLSGRPTVLLLGALILSFAGLSVGADLLVGGATGIAKAFGLSERVIGLTIVAIGTSLPELVASLVAAARNQHEMAVTNVVGSNVFNLLLILGAAGVVQPIPVAPALLQVDMWVMLGATAALLVLTARSARLSRGGGGVLVGGFIAYTAYLLTT